VAERVVRDRNRLSGGGVTAGIDFGLTLLAELAGDEVAQSVQLGLEYDPQPPFQSGSPEKAGAERTARVRAQMEKMIARRQEANARAAGASGVDRSNSSLREARGGGAVIRDGGVMSNATGAHDPSAPSGHLPFAVSAKGRKNQKDQALAEALSMVIALPAAMSYFNRRTWSRSRPVTRTKRLPSG
jgi:hypothetical protein